MLVPGYDMIAIDLDGTLLDSSKRVGRRCGEMIAEARRQGVAVTVCTGRNLPESLFALEAIGQQDPVVVAGGAIVACPLKRVTLRRFAIDLDVARRAVTHMLGSGHVAMALKDPVAAGYDYLMITGEPALVPDPVITWWFEQMDVQVRWAASLDDDEHPEHTVRIGVCAMNHALDGLMDMLRGDLADLAEMHHFPAVVPAEVAARFQNGERTHILEVFARGANKWSAVQEVARMLGRDPGRICAIGDDINDLPMIRSAALGVAMANAVAPVCQAASRHTLANDAGGVAHALEMILSGAW